MYVPRFADSKFGLDRQPACTPRTIAATGAQRFSLKEQLGVFETGMLCRRIEARATVGMGCLCLTRILFGAKLFHCA